MILIILAIAIGITFYFIIKKGNQQKKEIKEAMKAPKLDMSEAAKWTQQERDLIVEINVWRGENNFHWLMLNDKLKVFSQCRVNYWIKNKTPINGLHDWIFAHIKTHLRKDFIKVGENGQAGFKKIVRAYKLSPEHTASILGDWKYMAITVRKNMLGKNRTCLILAK